MQVVLFQTHPKAIGKYAEDHQIRDFISTVPTGDAKKKAFDVLAGYAHAAVNDETGQYAGLMADDQMFSKVYNPVLESNGE